jgi:hypothetical protein
MTAGARKFTAQTSLMSLACCILSVSAWAARPVRVYEVDVSGQTPAALQDAMRQALVRATGHRESANDPALTSIIEDAPKYVKNYTHGPRGETQVVFDSAGVERALAGVGRSVWDPERPFTLVVLYPPLNRGAEDAARAELEQDAAARGLLISLVPLSIIDASGNEVSGDALMQMAQRYGGDEVLVGRADAGTASGQWQWKLYTNFSSQSWTGPLVAGVDGTVDRLAPSLGASLAQTEVSARVEIDGITSLTDYATVDRLLESVPGVRRANVSEADGTKVTFDVTVRGGAEALDRALAGSSRLVRNSGTNARTIYQYRPASTPST